MGCWCYGAIAVAFLAALLGVMEVKHSALMPLQRSIILALDALLDGLQDPTGEGLDWATSFNGAMLPAQPVKNLPLVITKGGIPHDLSGVLLRVGPSTVQWPPKKRTHVFDGDGVVYSVRFQQGQATYNCAYLRTPRYEYEQVQGREWFMRLGELHGPAGLLKLFTTIRWKMNFAGLNDLDVSTANTAIGRTPDNKLWALNEGGRPFRFTVSHAGDIESVGFDNLQGTLKSAVSAHPKYDYATKEVFFHGRNLVNQQFYVGRIQDGILQEQTDLSVDPPVGQGFNHDMFITKDYVVIIDGSMRFDKQAVVTKTPLWTFDDTQKIRFGVYPRKAKQLTNDNFIWVVAPFNAEIVHTMAAHNEGEKIMLWTSMCDHDRSRDGQGVLGGMGPLKTSLLVIDVGAKSVTVEPVEGSEDFISEFGRVREDRVGQQARYAYTALERIEGWVEFNFTGVIKWDLQGKRRAGVIEFSPGVVGGEPIFIPREGKADEDDGYLAVQLWNTGANISSVVVYDAKTFSHEPVVELTVPKTRIPLAFHGWWLSEAELKLHLTKTS